MRSILIILLLATLVLTSCSGSSPVQTNPVDLNTPNSASSHALLGTFQLDINLDTMTATAIPLKAADAHINATSWLYPPFCPDCIGITVNGFDAATRILDVDLSIRNWTTRDGHDLRCIVFSTDSGHELVNEDNWITLDDIPGGGYYNPFIAYAKDEPNRIFAAGATHSENFQVLIPDPPHWEQLAFAIDVSWPGNCGEPYEISNFSNNPIGLTPNEAVNEWVDVFDWQDNVSAVFFFCPDVTGIYPLPFEHYVYQYWWIFLVNTEGAPAGEYDATIFAFSPDEPNIPLYHLIKVTVQ